MCKKFHHLKNSKTLYWNLPHRIVASLNSWDKVHINLIGPYCNSTIKQQPGEKKYQEGYEPHLNDDDWSWYRLVRNCWSTLLQPLRRSKGKYLIHIQIICKGKTYFKSYMAIQVPTSTRSHVAQWFLF